MFSACLYSLALQMAVECEQIRSELSRQKERLGKELSLYQERIVLARNTAHNEAGKEKEALDSTVSHHGLK